MVDLKNYLKDPTLQIGNAKTISVADLRQNDKGQTNLSNAIEDKKFHQLTASAEISATARKAWRSRDSSAIRLARGYTGRNKIIKFEGCYHGHLDSLLVKAGSGLVTFGESTSAGIPPSFAAETLVIPLDDRAALDEALEKYGHEIACIIIEPIPANNGLLLQDYSFLK